MRRSHVEASPSGAAGRDRTNTRHCLSYQAEPRIRLGIDANVNSGLKKSNKSSD